MSYNTTKCLSYFIGITKYKTIVYNNGKSDEQTTNENIVKTLL